MYSAYFRLRFKTSFTINLARQMDFNRWTRRHGRCITTGAMMGGSDAAARIKRVLWNDPATGVMRHADAGYSIALDCAREHGLNLPAIL
jgi:hypothetical protein